MATAKRDTDMRQALSELLKRKMLQTVRRGVGTQKAEDLIDEECRSFMAMSGEVEVKDLVELEARIHKKLDNIGVAKRTPLRVDEWAVLFKFQSEVAEIAEKRRQEELLRKRERLRNNLAEQVLEKEKAKVVAREAVKAIKLEQEEDLRKFKAEALARQAKDRERTAQLRVDRAAQLEEKAARQREEEHERRREEEQLKRAIFREHIATIRAEEAAKARQTEMAEEFLKGNAEQLAIKAQLKAEEERAALRMMHEFNERLRLQEEEHFAALEAMKAKQRRQEEMGNAVGPYKRYIDERIIQKNFEEREAALAAREEEAKADIQRKKERLRQDLAQQLEEKKRLKEAEKARDKAMNDMLQAEVRKGLLLDQQKKQKEKEKMDATMKMIKEQIAIVEASRKVITMSDTEKQINYEVLEMIPGSHIPLPPKGVVTNRYTPKMLEQEIMMRTQAGTTKPVKKESAH